MSDGHFIVDQHGWPRVISDEQHAAMVQRHRQRKTGTVRLADPAQAPAPAPAPVIELRGRVLLDLRQCAAVLSLSLDDATMVLSKMSTPRIVGFDAQSIAALRQQLADDPLLRAELGIERTGDGSTLNP